MIASRVATGSPHQPLPPLHSPYYDSPKDSAPEDEAGAGHLRLTHVTRIGPKAFDGIKPTRSEYMTPLAAERKCSHPPTKRTNSEPLATSTAPGHLSRIFLLLLRIAMY